MALPHNARKLHYGIYKTPKEQKEELKEKASVSNNNSNKAIKKVEQEYEDKEIEFEMTFRDNGCGISPEN